MKKTLSMQPRDRADRRCHIGAMTDDPGNGRMGGGIFIAIGPLAGLGIGFLIGEPSMGLIGGIAAGILVAAAFWALKR